MTGNSGPSSAQTFGSAPASGARYGKLALGLAIAFAILLRVWAASGDFWLDEIWSWTYARFAKSASDIFFKIRHDNNHHLNTLVLYLLGDQVNWTVYRIPAILSGAGVILLAGFAGEPTTFFRSWVTVLIFGTSFILVTYASEARGYGPMLFFALGAYLGLKKWLDSPSILSFGAFHICCVIGVLSHLSFLFFYLAACAWSAMRISRRGQNWGNRAAEIATLHAPAIAFMGWFYWACLRGLNYGGSNTKQPMEVAARCAALIFGLPQTGIWAAAALTLAALILAAELVFKWREGSDVWIFHLFAVWLSPEILTIIFAPRALMPRYYLVSVLFFMIVLVDFILRCRQWGRGGRTAALILLVLICGGNSWRVNQLIRVGRGHYLACVKYIAGHSTSPVLSIGGDHDARIALPLNYYMKYFPDRRVDYYSPHDPQPAPPEWFIAHDRGETESIPPLNPSHKLGARYELVAVYPAYGLSGMAWHLFRRVDG